MGVTTVIKDYGTDILNAIRENDLKKLMTIFQKQLKNDRKIAKLCVTDIKHRPTKKFACPLILAARQEDPRIIRYMMERGVDPNFVHHTIYSSKRREIVTALHIGVDLGLYDTVQVLLDANADCNIGDHNQETPLHIAVKKADRSMTRMLLAKGADPSIIDRRGNAVLHVATLYGHLQLVRSLLKYDADVYQRGQWGSIPPHIAAKEGHIHLIQLFCSRDVGNINIKIPCYEDDREKAPIHLAAENGHVETVLALLDQFDAEVNLPDSDGNTPLHCVVLNSYYPHKMRDKEFFTECARVLIKYRVSINSKNAFGDTALHLAAMNHYQRIVELLLEVGANPFCENEKGLKPLDVVPDADPVTKQVLKHAMLQPRPQMSASMDTLQMNDMTSGRNHLNRSRSNMSYASSQVSLESSVFGDTMRGSGQKFIMPAQKKNRKDSSSRDRKRDQDSILEESQYSELDPRDEREREHDREREREHERQREREKSGMYAKVNKDAKQDAKQQALKQTVQATVNNVKSKYADDDEESVMSRDSFMSVTSQDTVSSVRQAAPMLKPTNKKDKNNTKQQTSSRSNTSRSNEEIGTQTPPHQMSNAATNTQKSKKKSTSTGTQFDDMGSLDAPIPPARERDRGREQDDDSHYQNFNKYREEQLKKKKDEESQKQEDFKQQQLILQQQIQQQIKEQLDQHKLEQQKEVEQKQKSLPRSTSTSSQGSGPISIGGHPGVEVKNIPGKPGTIELQYGGGPITISVDQHGNIQYTVNPDASGSGHTSFEQNNDEFNEDYTGDFSETFDQTGTSQGLEAGSAGTPPQEVRYAIQEQVKTYTESNRDRSLSNESDEQSQGILLQPGKQQQKGSFLGLGKPQPSDTGQETEDQPKPGGMIITEEAHPTSPTEHFEEEPRRRVPTRQYDPDQKRKVTTKPELPLKPSMKPNQKQENGDKNQKEPARPMHYSRAVSFSKVQEEEEELSPDNSPNSSPKHKSFSQAMAFAKKLEDTPPQTRKFGSPSQTRKQQGQGPMISTTESADWNSQNKKESFVVENKSILRTEQVRVETRQKRGEFTIVKRESSYAAGEDLIPSREGSESESESGSDDEEEQVQKITKSPVFKKAFQHPQEQHNQFYSITGDIEVQDSNGNGKHTQKPKPDEDLPYQSYNKRPDDLQEFDSEPGGRRLNRRQPDRAESPMSPNRSLSPGDSELSYGRRGIGMRVTGETPKAYTRGTKNSARTAFMKAPPVGIESDSENELGSKNSLNLSRGSIEETSPPRSGSHREYFSEPIKPVYIKTGTKPTGSLAPLSPSSKTPSEHGPKSPRGKIIGPLPKPYKSFGTIETKVDALQEISEGSEGHSDNDVFGDSHVLGDTKAYLDARTAEFVRESAKHQAKMQYLETPEERNRRMSNSSDRINTTWEKTKREATTKSMPNLAPKHLQDKMDDDDEQEEKERAATLPRKPSVHKDNEDRAATLPNKPSEHKDKIVDVSQKQTVSVREGSTEEGSYTVTRTVKTTKIVQQVAGPAPVTMSDKDESEDDDDDKVKNPTKFGKATPFAGVDLGSIKLKKTGSPIYGRKKDPRNSKDEEENIRQTPEEDKDPDFEISAYSGEPGQRRPRPPLDYKNERTPDVEVYGSEPGQRRPDVEVHGSEPGQRRPQHRKPSLETNIDDDLPVGPPGAIIDDEVAEISQAAEEKKKDKERRKQHKTEQTEIKTTQDALISQMWAQQHPTGQQQPQGQNNLDQEIPMDANDDDDDRPSYENLPPRPQDSQRGQRQMGQRQPGHGHPGQGQPYQGQPGQGQPNQEQPFQGQPNQSQMYPGQPHQGSPMQQYPGQPGMPHQQQPGEFPGNRPDLEAYGAEPGQRHPQQREPPEAPFDTSFDSSNRVPKKKGGFFNLSSFSKGKKDKKKNRNSRGSQENISQIKEQSQSPPQGHPGQSPPHGHPGQSPPHGHPGQSPQNVQPGHVTPSKESQPNSPGSNPSSPGSPYQIGIDSTYMAAPGNLERSDTVKKNNKGFLNFGSKRKKKDKDEGSYGAVPYSPPPGNEDPESIQQQHDPANPDQRMPHLNQRLNSPGQQPGVDPYQGSGRQPQQTQGADILTQMWSEQQGRPNPDDRTQRLPGQTRPPGDQAPQYRDPHNHPLPERPQDDQAGQPKKPRVKGRNTGALAQHRKGGHMPQDGVGPYQGATDPYGQRQPQPQDGVGPYQGATDPYGQRQPQPYKGMGSDPNHPSYQAPYPEGQQYPQGGPPHMGPGHHPTETNIDDDIPHGNQSPHQLYAEEPGRRRIRSKATETNIDDDLEPSGPPGGTPIGRNFQDLALSSIAEQESQRQDPRRPGPNHQHQQRGGPPQGGPNKHPYSDADVTAQLWSEQHGRPAGPNQPNENPQTTTGEEHGENEPIDTGPVSPKLREMLKDDKRPAYENIPMRTKPIPRTSQEISAEEAAMISMTQNLNRDTQERPYKPIQGDDKQARIYRPAHIEGQAADRLKKTIGELDKDIDDTETVAELWKSQQDQEEEKRRMLQSTSTTTITTTEEILNTQQQLPPGGQQPPGGQLPMGSRRVHREVKETNIDDDLPPQNTDPSLQDVAMTSITSKLQQDQKKPKPASPGPKPTLAPKPYRPKPVQFQTPQRPKEFQEPDHDALAKIWAADHQVKLKPEIVIVDPEEDPNQPQHPFNDPRGNPQGRRNLPEEAHLNPQSGARRPIKKKGRRDRVSSDRTFEDAAFEAMKGRVENEPDVRTKRTPKGEQEINYTRGVYRPVPLHFRGSSSGGQYGDSELSGPDRFQNVTESEGEVEHEDMPEPSVGDSSEISGIPHRQMSNDPENKENFPSAFFPVAPTGHQRDQQMYQMESSISEPSGKRPRRKKKDRAPRYKDPIPVDLNQYSETAKLWMEQVDKESVARSKTMYMQVMPDNANIPKKYEEQLPVHTSPDDVFLPPQWVIARGRTLRSKSRKDKPSTASDPHLSVGNMSGMMSDSDFEMNPERPLSPGKQAILFFRIGSNWRDLAWVLFSTIMSEAEIMRMIKDIQLKHKGDLKAQVQDMMARWWKKKGQYATIEELQSALDFINLGYINEDYYNHRMGSVTQYTDTEDDLDISEISDNDPDVSRLMEQYNVRSLNNSFEVERSPNSKASSISRENILRQKGGQRYGSSRDAMDRQHNISHDDSMEAFSDTDSRRFMIIQPQLKSSDYRHESNV